MDFHSEKKAIHFSVVVVFFYVCDRMPRHVSFSIFFHFVQLIMTIVTMYKNNNIYKHRTYVIYFMQLTHTFLSSVSFNRTITRSYTCHCTIFHFIILLIVSAIILIGKHLHIVVNKLTPFIVAKGWMKTNDQTMNQFFKAILGFSS